MNSNGVRDDVERKIYFRYKRPIIQAFMMQCARFFPKQLVNPKQAAVSPELKDEEWNLFSCKGYLRNKGITIPKGSIDFIENSYVNTKERFNSYVLFNQASSGKTYRIPIHSKDQKAENCDFNITLILEMEKQGGK
ncbi:hypothetical protein WCX18_07895 [Sulfurimonas sp. HSL1-2]|uniref:hypothetical protein n=1 Tax=Thiomicrolovo zhangzhouensis TaxID=3131933 RepID=UPI0031F9DA82